MGSGRPDQCIGVSLPSVRQVTVAGFRGRNGLRRRGAGGLFTADASAPADVVADDATDDRRTPPTIFDPLMAEFGFTLDAAANADNAKCAAHFDRAKDGLAQSWAGHVVWCNPPFSNILAWVEKALLEVASGCPRVVMLLPANRCEQPWWQRLIEPVRDIEGSGVRTRFLKGRPRFGTATIPCGQRRGNSGSGPYGVVLVIIEPKRAA